MSDVNKGLLALLWPATLHRMELAYNPIYHSLSNGKMSNCNPKPSSAKVLAGQGFTILKIVLNNVIFSFLFHQYLPQCDRVLHIQDGRVAGFDLHAKLLEDSSEYATLYKSHMDSVEKEEYER